MIGIHQVDGKLPNYACMKIAGYYKSLNVPFESYKGDLFNEQYDKVYMSKIFHFSSMPEIYDNCIIGGTGIDHYNKLPPEIEIAEVSYDLYPNCNYHLGFSMKGCRFACKFCVVPKKEGKPYNYNTIDELLKNPYGENRLMLLDNDFFGGFHWKANLERIIELKLKVCFVQGLNIRIITYEQATLLAQCNFSNSKFNQKYLTFAFDKFKDEKLILEGIRICNEAGIRTSQMQFFVLIGFDTTHEENMYRINLLKNLGAKPFVMPYDKSDPYQKALTRYVNHRAIFNKCSWQEYKYSKIYK